MYLFIYLVIHLFIHLFTYSRIYFLVFLKKQYAYYLWPAKAAKGIGNYDQL